MAEVRRRLGRGAYDFARKTRSRYLPESRNKQGESAVRSSSPSAGFLLGDIHNGGLCGAGNAADRVTVGVSQDGYTRVTPLFGSVNNVNNVAEYYYYNGLDKEYSLSNKTQVPNIDNAPPFCPFQKFQRTFCTSGSARQPSLGGLFWGQGQFVFIRAYSGNGGRSDPLYRTKTGYYDILEVTPTATRAQIKTAYYKQSFVYHPDRNAGSDEATVRFSEISEAYTVLGNKALRKKYDRGLLSQSDLNATARPSSAKGAAGSSGKPQTEGRRAVVGADSRGGVSDFDSFFKTYYNEQLQRQKDIRVRKEEMLRKKEETIGEKKLGGMMEMGVGVLLAVAVALLLSLKRR